MSMDYEKMGIVATIVILCSVMAVATISSGEIDLDISSDESKISFPTASTKSDNAYYEWCYKMKVDCS